MTRKEIQAQIEVLKQEIDRLYDAVVDACEWLFLYSSVVHNLTTKEDQVPKTINIDGVEYNHTITSEASLIKEKLSSTDDYIYCPAFEHKLIHKKHRDVLDAYLANNDVEIEYNHHESGFELIHRDFIEHYDERLDYRIKPKM